MLKLTDQNFEQEVIKADIPVLVDCFAPWCAPCQAAGPVIDELAKEYQGKVKAGKIDVDGNPQTAQKYKVLSIPTLIIFNGGKEIKRLVGFPGKVGYEKLIKEVLK